MILIIFIKSTLAKPTMANPPAFKVVYGIRVCVRLALKYSPEAKKNAE